MTNKFTEKEALVICFKNLKGSKSKDLMLTAKALKFLRSLPKFKSNRCLGEEVGVSGEIVRQFISLLDLPPPVQLSLERGKLGLEQGRRLRQLQQVRPSLVMDAAVAMESLSAMETRDLTEYLIRIPTSSVQIALETLEAAKPSISHEFHIEAILDEHDYKSLEVHARKQQIRVNELVSMIIRHWLAGGYESQLR